MSPLPEFAPLFPSMEWWRIFLSRRLEMPDTGGDDALRLAVRLANTESRLKSREWMRFAVCAPARAAAAADMSAQVSVLSLPVEGSASALKNRHPRSWMLAREALREAEKIKATLATAYGRTPYFHILADTLFSGSGFGGNTFTGDGPAGRPSAGDVCDEAFSGIVSLLCLDDDRLLRDLRERMKRGDAVLRNVRGDVLQRLGETGASLSGAGGGVSILHSLFHIGPDTVFALLPSFL